MENALKRFWEANRRVIVICLIATFVWGLAAHGYGFANFQLSHDSLDGLYAEMTDNDHKIELGRVFAPYYRLIVRGMFAMPWMSGLLALVWIAAAVICVANLFDVKKPLVLVLISGLMTVNLTVTALSATYLHDLDINMFGMLLSCAAALVWQRRTRGWFAVGALCVGLSLGMYQSYVSVTVALVMMALILRLLDGEKPAQALKSALLGALMVIAGGVIYALSMKGIVAATGVEIAQRSNSVSALSNLTVQALPALLGGTYAYWWQYFADMPSVWIAPEWTTVLNMAVLMLTVAALAALLVKKNTGAVQKVLAVVIVLLLPLGMNACYVLASGAVHDLMEYAFVLVYVLPLVLLGRLNIRPARAVCAALAMLLLWGGVQTANTVHFKKGLVAQATYSRMTNVAYDMLYYGYVPGETEVFVSGAIPFGGYPGFEQVDRILGVNQDNAVTRDTKSIRSYFTYVLGDNIVFATEEQQESIMATENFEYMSRWPEEGYITVVDDVMVVKLN